MNAPTLPTLYGLMAEFEDAEQLLAAARKIRDLGYRRTDAFSPLPVEGLCEALGDHRPSRVPLIVLLGGLIGGVGTFATQSLASIFHYPLDIGGKAYFSWPGFIPITYELTILSASAAAVFGMLALNRLPMLYHPTFNVERFGLASRDKFFLCVESADPLFDAAKTRQVLEGLQPSGVYEVAS